MHFSKIFLLLILLVQFNFYGQNEYDLFGILKLNGNDKTVITYRLVFYENNGKISGYSISDLGGNDETKNKIIGTYNSKTKELNFKETDVIYTKSTFNLNTFCYVYYKGKVKLIQDKLKIEGDFKGFYANNKSCINGTLKVIGIQKINKLVNKINHKIQSSKKVDQKTKDKFNTNKLLDSLKNSHLTSNQNLSISWESDEFIFEIWDNGKLDGDKINLYKDDKLILHNYEVSLDKKTINIDSKKNFKLKIEAINEGKIAPNTAKIILIDKDKKTELFSNLKKGESSTITIFKKT